MIGFELGNGAESPGDTDGIDARPSGSLHVDSGIAYVENVGFRSGAFGENLEYDRRIGLDRDSFFLPFDRRPFDGGEIVARQGFDCRLVFVGRNSYLYSLVPL